MSDEHIERLIKAIEILTRTIEQGFNDIKDGLESVSASVLELSEVMEGEETTYND